MDLCQYFSQIYFRSSFSKICMRAAVVTAAAGVTSVVEGPAPVEPRLAVGSALVEPVLTSGSPALVKPVLTNVNNAEHSVQLMQPGR